MPQVDIGTETYEVYADVDFADAWLAADVARAAGWAMRNPDAKARGLVSATRMLLGLPWVDGLIPDFDTAPAVVAQVCAMLAADLLGKPALFGNPAGNSNVKNVKAASAAVEFFRPVDGGPPLPISLWNMLLAANLVGSSVSDIVLGPFVSGIYGGCRPLEGRRAWDWPIAEQDYM